ncbi:N-acetyllactosaminide beta-1,3-N-acetylglucosaminyltransferase 2 [Echeneis naucrates]|uniref:Hexosyltransferase n=1 Tax=Echeneis naucrates TaxID=173247 RepID=A0A665V4A7_ECHNA|nr:UDP-GlcNAc:betaGal beta-1,3-N-acetylglucosaminyltransferase 8 [Echeneis naucrates]
MKRIRSFSAVVFLITLIMILYLTINLETTYSYKAGPEAVLRDITVQAGNSNVKTQSPHVESFTIPQPRVHNMSISDDFRNSIPHNQAYWNRLLHLSLKNLDKWDDPLRHDPHWSHCTKNEELLKTNIPDFSSYPVLFQDFVRGMSCMSSPVLISQPNKCISQEGRRGNQTLLLLAIKSAPWNFEQRQAVRETWGRERVYHGGLRVRRVFVLGNSPLEHPDLSPLLSFEANNFGDLLQWDFKETFLNLTLKMNLFFQWTLKHCPHASFVFSGDDDVFVNTPRMVSYLLSLKGSQAYQLFVGDVIKTASPLRDPKIKYYVPLSFYDGPYPAYAGGGGFLFSGQLLKSLYSVSHFVPFFPIDDVYIGMCAKAMGISPQAHSEFLTFDIKVQDRENLCAYKDIILIHKRLPVELKQLWKGIHSPFLTC